MASQKIDQHSLEEAVAAEDLSTYQYKLVKLNESGELVKAVAGDVAFVLQNKPKSGEVGTYATGGRVKAVAGGTIKAGEMLSSNASSEIVQATAGVVTEQKVTTQGTRVIGYALEGGASGDVVAFRATPTAGRA